ncbi:PTS system, beta-glucosides-specific IIC component [Anaerovirgula multivorans]|uniref:PTS system, beta-glucosides-specific IIC component n=1 Tax=Anaerovirgula multivorans TaxID=312168 RepID=A0A239C7L6_9FIRM|nr:PTS transporter subunit EIIC [Anaerovirgula multivorans]SNS15658.1 PTS system, beta-glucosides-specific IIC component [Anaerovirgula multivorans]
MKHDEKKKLLSKLIAAISDMFMPLMNLMCAGGIMKGALLILTTTSFLSDSSETYLILNAISDSTFYFLPVLLAITSAKTFRANPFYSTVIALILLYPSLTKAFETGTTLHFFTLPIKAVTYHSSIFPIIAASALLAVTEHFLERILPELVRGFLTPLLSLSIVSLSTLFVFGPIGAIIGDALAAGYALLYSFSSAVAGILLGALIQPMVIFGFQWGLFLVAINNIGVTGHDSIVPIIAPAIFAQAGAALAVMVKSRNISFRSLCASAILSALFGITEPVLFNINLPRKKPFLFGCIGGAVGGLLAGLSKIETPTFVLPSLITLPIYYGDHFMLYLTGCLSGFMIGFVLTILIASDTDTAVADTGALSKGGLS